MDDWWPVNLLAARRCLIFYDVPTVCNPFYKIAHLIYVSLNNPTGQRRLHVCHAYRLRYLVNHSRSPEMLTRFFIISLFNHRIRGWILWLQMPFCSKKSAAGLLLESPEAPWESQLLFLTFKDAKSFFNARLRKQLHWVLTLHTSSKS